MKSESKNGAIPPGPPIMDFLKKVKQRQDAVLAEKASKWGFDFASSAPKPLQDNDGCVKSESSVCNQIDWLPMGKPDSDYQQAQTGESQKPAQKSKQCALQHFDGLGGKKDEGQAGPINEAAQLGTQRASSAGHTRSHTQPIAQTDKLLKLADPAQLHCILEQPHFCRENSFQVPHCGEKHDQMATENKLFNAPNAPKTPRKAATARHKSHVFNTEYRKFEEPVLVSPSRKVLGVNRTLMAQSRTNLNLGLSLLPARNAIEKLRLHKSDQKVQRKLSSLQQTCNQRRKEPLRQGGLDPERTSEENHLTNGNERTRLVGKRAPPRNILPEDLEEEGQLELRPLGMLSASPVCKSKQVLGVPLGGLQRLRLAQSPMPAKMLPTPLLESADWKLPFPLFLESQTSLSCARSDVAVNGDLVFDFIPISTTPVGLSRNC